MVKEGHTFPLCRVETKPELLQWREEGLKPPHLEKRVWLMLGREWEGNRVGGWRWWGREGKQ